MCYTPVMPKGRPKSRLRLLAEEYLLANPYASTEMICDATRVNPATVTRIRKDLVKRGLIRASIHDWSSPEGRSAKSLEPEGAKIDTEGVEKVLAKLEELRTPTGDPLTTEESLQLLSSLARAANTDGNSKLAIDATMAFHRLQDRTTAVQLGPPPPLTDEDKITRMTHLVDVVGPVILASATFRALSAEDLCAFEEELGRLKATHPLPIDGATVQAAPSSPEGTSPYAPQP